MPNSGFRECQEHQVSSASIGWGYGHGRRTQFWLVFKNNTNIRSTVVLVMQSLDCEIFLCRPDMLNQNNDIGVFEEINAANSDGTSTQKELVCKFMTEFTAVKHNAIIICYTMLSILTSFWCVATLSHSILSNTKRKAWISACIWFYWGSFTSNVCELNSHTRLWLCVDA